MSCLIINGGKPLEGTIPISGAKNSALAIIVAAALATEGETVLENIPGNRHWNHLFDAAQFRVEIWFDDESRLHVRGQS